MGVQVLAQGYGFSGSFGRQSFDTGKKVFHKAAPSFGSVNC